MKTYKTEVNGLDCLIGYLGKHEILPIHYVTFKIDQFICNFCPIHEIPEGKYIVMV